MGSITPVCNAGFDTIILMRRFAVKNYLSVLLAVMLMSAAGAAAVRTAQGRCPTLGDARQQKYFEVCAASTHVSGAVYMMDVRVFYGLSKTVSDALDSGVPITFALQIEINRQRKWMWDETIATLTQRFRIQYHALTQKYIVINLNSNAHTSYPTRSLAISAISHLRHLPLIDTKLIDRGQLYYGRLRSRLVVSDLPSSLRLWAYLSSEWRLKSEWYQWEL